MNKTYLLLFFTVLSCKQMQKVSDAVTNPSARTVYERIFTDQDSLYAYYRNTYQKARNNGLTLPLPASVSAVSDSVTEQVLGYTVSVKRGEELVVNSAIAPDSLQLMIDVFLVIQDSIVSTTPMIANQPSENSISYPISKVGMYKVVVFPQKKHQVAYSVEIYTRPSLGFPVSGTSDKAIQSFWGASRSGGTRMHKGIDIFAKRGTPVIAATKGWISSTGNRGLGGKQVWLRDGLLGQSLYYAHLDSIAVNPGMRVNRGDTLGFVGNTGNAKTTPPHLHFGIYTQSGAVDPLPYVRLAEVPDNAMAELPQHGVTRRKKNELRTGPSVRHEQITRLSLKEKLKLKAKTKRWYHVKVNDTLEGFMHESLIRMP